MGFQGIASEWPQSMLCHCETTYLGFGRPAQCGTLLATSLGTPSVWELGAIFGILEGGSGFWKVLCSSLDDVNSKASMHFWSLEFTVYLLGAQDLPHPQVPQWL